MKALSKFLVISAFLFLFAKIAVGQNNGYTILISFDGFRWDYANRGISPNLDYIKNNGVSALSLKPSFPSKTFPNHYTIVTGLYPQNHGIIANNFINPINGKIFKVGDTAAVRNPEWYKGEAIWETARRQGVKTASYFWPGSEVNQISRRPDYYEKYEHMKDYNLRIDGVINWLKLPYADRPRLITMYFDATDTYGHNFGTNSLEINFSIMKLDSLIGKLFEGLKNINLIDSTNIIIVSDHGMTDISSNKIINVQELLNGIDCTYWDMGPVMYLLPAKELTDKVYNTLKKSERNFKIYKKSEMPDYFHFSESYIIPDLILVADPGWSLVTDKDLKKYSSNYSGGNHGYDNNYLDMHGIFFAIGPDFKKGYKTGTLNNIDIYPLLADLLGIFPNQKIDGNLENIKFVLKKY